MPEGEEIVPEEEQKEEAPEVSDQNEEMPDSLGLPTSTSSAFKTSLGIPYCLCIAVIDFILKFLIYRLQNY